MEKNAIVVKCQTEFIHRYKNAPMDVAFLRDWHRHILHIEVEMEVFHEDRELEFILVKRTIQAHLGTTIKLIQVEKSCEAVAREIKEVLLLAYGDRDITITVSEDGENAGKLYYTREGK